MILVTVSGNDPDTWTLPSNTVQTFQTCKKVRCCIRGQGVSGGERGVGSCERGRMGCEEGVRGGEGVRVEIRSRFPAGPVSTPALSLPPCAHQFDCTVVAVWLLFDYNIAATTKHSRHSRPIRNNPAPRCSTQQHIKFRHCWLFAAACLVVPCRSNSTSLPNHQAQTKSVTSYIDMQ